MTLDEKFPGNLKEIHLTNYAKTKNGNMLPPTPKGWEIIEAGGDIPQEHVCCIEDYYTGYVMWVQPRRCHSTMTAMWAMVWGGDRAYARKIQS